MATPNFRAAHSAPENASGKGRRSSPLHRLSQSENEGVALPASGVPASGATPDAQELALFADEADVHTADLNGAALDTADDASMREFYSRLVTLLTQDNASESGSKKGANAFVVALRRRWLPALLLMALAFFGLYSLLKPRQISFLANTTLLLPPRDSQSNKDPFAPPEDSYDTSAQLAIIGSDPIVNRALARVPAALRQSGWGDPNIKRVNVNVNALSIRTA